MAEEKLELLLEFLGPEFKAILENVLLYSSDCSGFKIGLSHVDFEFFYEANGKNATFPIPFGDREFSIYIVSEEIGLSGKYSLAASYPNEDQPSLN